MTKRKFILKNSSLAKMLVVFPPIFVVDTRLIYGYNFVAPLNVLILKVNSSLSMITACMLIEKNEFTFHGFRAQNWFCL